MGVIVIYQGCHGSYCHLPGLPWELLSFTRVAMRDLGFYHGCYERLLIIFYQGWHGRYKLSPELAWEIFTSTRVAMGDIAPYQVCHVSCFSSGLPWKLLALTRVATRGVFFAMSVISKFFGGYKIPPCVF